MPWVELSTETNGPNDSTLEVSLLLLFYMWSEPLLIAEPIVLA